jgi:hypothetical protein
MGRKPLILMMKRLLAVDVGVIRSRGLKRIDKSTIATLVRWIIIGLDFFP